MKIKKISRNSFVGLAGCCGVLSLLAVAMLFPVQGNSASASEDDGTSARNIEYETSQVTLEIAKANVTTNIDPKANNGFNANSTNVRVTVANSGGYQVYLQTDTSALSGSTSGNGALIQSMDDNSGNGRTPGQFQDNTWGYSFSAGQSVPSDSTVYMPVPTVKTAVTEKLNGPNSTTDFTLSFGAKVGTDIVADTYGGSVTLSVVSEPLAVTIGLMRNDVVYMQDMTPAICDNTLVGETKQLIDRRDNKKYWVAKLADGNCWMTQNLDLDLTTAGLNTSTSDLVSNWNATSNGGGQQEVKYPPTQTSTTMPNATSNPSQVTTYSWDQGLYVYSTPTATTSCGSQALGIIACSNATDAQLTAAINAYNADSSHTTKLTLEGVKNSRNGVTSFINVTTGYTASTDPEFYTKSSYKGTDGTTNCTKAANNAVSTATSGVCAQYDAHYLIGNYYQWNAATAGSGGTIVNADATASICPKGWKLPTSGTEDNGTGTQVPRDVDGSFYHLLKYYGLTSQVTTPSGVPGLTEGQYNIALSPLFFVRSGLVVTIDLITHKNLALAGYYGYEWTSTPSSTSDNVHAISMPIYGTFPEGSSPRHAGHSLRCLSR